MKTTARDNEFREFFAGESARLQRFATMLVGDPNEASELAQEALVRVYKRWGRVREGSPSAYARRTVLNLVRSAHRYNRLRRERPGMESVVRSWLQAIQDGDEDAAWALMSEGARAEVGRADFDQLMASALPESFGEFADPSLDIEFVEVEISRGNTRIVATITGAVEQEGVTAFTAQAIPCRSWGLCS